MVRRSDQDSVDVLLVFEHVAIVGVAFGLRQMFCLEFDHSSSRAWAFMDRTPQAARPAVAGQAVLFAFFTLSMSRLEPVKSFVGIAPVHVAEAQDVLACEVDQLLRPMPPTPMPATFSVSLGGVNPREDVPGNNGARGAAGGTFVRNCARNFFLFAHGISLG